MNLVSIFWLIIICSQGEIRICYHYYNFFEIFVVTSGSEPENVAKCPAGFPNLEKHTGSNNGDICRNEKIHGLNVGWNCIPGCFGRNSAPWCVKSGTQNSPCRAGKKLFHTASFIFCVKLKHYQLIQKN